jgi:hypothetical protein
MIIIKADKQIKQTQCQDKEERAVTRYSAKTKVEKPLLSVRIRMHCNQDNIIYI